MMNIIRIALDFDVINFGNFLNSGNNILCFVLSMALPVVLESAWDSVSGREMNPACEKVSRHQQCSVSVSLWF